MDKRNSKGIIKPFTIVEIDPNREVMPPIKTVLLKNSSHKTMNNERKAYYLSDDGEISFWFYKTDNHKRSFFQIKVIEKL